MVHSIAQTIYLKKMKVSWERSQFSSFLTTFIASKNCNWIRSNCGL